MDKMKQFLADEQELLNDLAHDVANADTPYEYQKAKSLFDIQMARVSGIKDSIAMLGQ